MENFEIQAQKELSAVQGLLQKIDALAIKTQEDAGIANDYLKNAKAKAKEIEATRVSFVKPFNDQVKFINDWFRKPMDGLAEIEKKLKAKIMDYDNEVRRKLAKEEAKLRAEAAERERKEREKLEARAAKAEEKGKTEKAEELRQQAEEVYVPAPVLAAPKSTMSYRTDYDFEVVDKALVPEDYKIVDEVMLRRVVKAQKELCKIPGIKIITKQVPISR